MRPLLPEGASVLDIGCGDGLLAHLLRITRPDLDIAGVDVVVRPHASIPVSHFNGQKLPHGDASVDVALLIDVLHHTTTPMVLLLEAVRVARMAVVIKDHLCDRPFARPTLRIMDWIGNAHHGVVLPYNYWTARQWRQAFENLPVRVAHWLSPLRLYPWTVDWLFGGSLHFIARLDRAW